MSSVTGVIKTTKQPYGGYLRIKDFKVINMSDGIELYDIQQEDIHASLVGLAVDYLFRYCIGTDKADAFAISLIGAGLLGNKHLKQAIKLLKEIELDNGYLTDKSIFNACKLVGYDVVYRVGALFFVETKYISPNNETISNIRTMVNRCITFNKEYGEIIEQGMTFDGAYTNKIHIGDADFMTKDCLWDLKVSNQKPNKNHSLQLLIYYLLGINSVNSIKYKDINKIGIFNPRLNTLYTYNISDISDEILIEVGKNVIGFNLDEAILKFPK